MLREQRPDLPVLFLETFHHFPQTLEYRDTLTREWGINLINLKAPEAKLGLWQTEGTQACCAHHKVGPLFSALEDYDVWFTALRRDQSPSRANLQEVEPFRLPGGKTITRVAPLASWTARDVWRYAKEHGIALMPLYELGYTSIGCEPCTTPPVDPDNPRSGRWQGAKLECGIHIQAK
jgi:phosphoadenosine phosphosulfate reductase